MLIVARNLHVLLPTTFTSILLLVGTANKRLAVGLLPQSVDMTADQLHSFAESRRDHRFLLVPGIDLKSVNSLGVF